MRVAPVDRGVAPVDHALEPPPPPPPPWPARLRALAVGAAIVSNAAVLASADLEAACVAHAHRVWAFHACTLAVWTSLLPVLCFCSLDDDDRTNRIVDSKAAPPPLPPRSRAEAIRDALLRAQLLLLLLVGAGVQTWAVAQLWAADPSWHWHGVSCRFFAACHGAPRWPYATSCAVYRGTSALLVGAIVATVVATVVATAVATIVATAVATVIGYCYSHGSPRTRRPYCPAASQRVVQVQV